MNKQETRSPFKFLDSYEAGDADIFFGRDRELNEIHSKVFQSRMLLVYGASGTGKSSIINCGLSSKLEDHDWLPISIRRGGHIVKSMINQAQNRAGNPITYSASDLSPQTVHKAFSNVYLDHFKPVYLIFDQFEELFIFGLKDEWLQFMRVIRYLLDSDLDIHFIFVLRGEYLEFLSEFESEIPEFFDNRMRVEKMTRTHATEIISGPAGVFNLNLEDGFEEKLINKLNPDTAQVELTFLQVFLDKLYKQAAAQTSDKKNITLTNDAVDKLGQIGDVLAEFVDEQIFKMSDPKTALAILKAFVSLQGTKTQCTIEQVMRHLRDLNYHTSDDEASEMLVQFVNKRILKEKDENDQYELRHDSLAQKIYEKITLQERELLDVRHFLNFSLNEYQKRGLLLTSDDLTYIAPFERNIQFTPELEHFIQQSKKHSSKEKAKRRRRTAIASVIVILMITSVIGFINSQSQRKQAEASAQLALAKSDEAELERKNAEEQKSLAEQNAASAKEQARLAEIQRQNAEEARSEAQQQKVIAQQQEQIALKEKAAAVLAQKIAAENAREAEQAKSRAEAESQKNLRLRLLSLAKEIAIKSSYNVSPELQGLMAIQAYYFNINNEGTPHPDFYHALYHAGKSLGMTDLRSLPLYTQPITSMIWVDGELWTCSLTGNVNASKITNGVLQSRMIIQSSHEFNFIAKADKANALILASLDNRIFRLNLKDNNLIELAQAEAEPLTIGNTNNKLLVITKNGKVQDYSDPKTPETIIDLSYTISAAILQNEFIWIAGDSKLTKFNLTNLEKTDLLTNSLSEITSLEMSDDGSLLAVGKRSGEILIINTDDGRKQQRTGHTAAITDLEFINNSDQLASTSFDRSVRIWPLKNAANPPIKIQDRNNWIAQIEIDEHNGYFYTGEYDGSIRGFHLNEAQMVDELCQAIHKDLTLEEWNTVISPEIDYSAKTNCQE
jgi:hypothetical protein